MYILSKGVRYTSQYLDEGQNIESELSSRETRNSLGCYWWFSFVNCREKNARLMPRGTRAQMKEYGVRTKKVANKMKKEKK